MNLFVRKSEKDQKFLSAEERFQNMKENLLLKKTSLPPQGDFLILDDIFTTGATVGTCAALLKSRRPEARVFVLTLGLVP